MSPLTTLIMFLSARNNAAKTFLGSLGWEISFLYSLCMGGCRIREVWPLRILRLAIVYQLHLRRWHKMFIGAKCRAIVGGAFFVGVVYGIWLASLWFVCKPLTILRNGHPVWLEATSLWWVAVLLCRLNSESKVWSLVRSVRTLIVIPGLVLVYARMTLFVQR